MYRNTTCRTEQCTNEDSSFTPEYKRLRSLALGLIFVWPIGFPLAVAVLLYVCRRSSLMAQRTGLANAVYFLHAEYNVYYWELIELGRRSILMVSELCLIAPNSAE